MTSGNNGHSANGDGESKPKPVLLGIAILRQFVAVGLPGKHRDAFVVAMVILELQDYCKGRAVGFYMGQLAKKAGLPDVNPRRLRNALEYLRINGYLELTVPPAGSRSQTLFKLILKTGDTIPNPSSEQLTPSEDGSATPNQNGKGTPYQNGSMTPNQNGSTSNPVYSNPVLNDPVLSNPPPKAPQKGGRLFGQDEEPKSKPSKNGKQPASEDQVNALYEAYPKHVAREHAVRAIAKALKIVPFDQLLSKVREYAAAKAGSQFIKNPATWFNGHCWNDDPESWRDSSTTGNSRRSLAGGAGVTYDSNAKAKSGRHGDFLNS